MENKETTSPFHLQKVKYCAMANATSEVIWIQNLLRFLKILLTPALLLCDNQAALHITANYVFHEHTKHIEVDYLFVRKHLLFGDIRTCYTPTTEQLVSKATFLSIRLVSEITYKPKLNQLIAKKSKSKHY
uniref:Reverse transcriptase Ty1/copia-type domain-containing protein n=1 Tax=Opuntia streptacantha TaxID=393608 RepID=A0A7C9D547_OPUST